MPNSDQHRPPEGEPEFAALIAIDWADQKHVWALEVAGSGKREHGELAHTPEAIEKWVGELAARFGNRPIAVALEQSRGALLYTLTKYELFVLYPVHPTMLAKFREAFYPSGAKDDPQDADLLLDLLRQHRSRLRRLDPDTVETRTLQFLVEERRNLVEERVRHSNQLTAKLKLYFPQILDWFDDVASELVGAVLTRWPTLEALQQVPPEDLRRFLRQHHCRSREGIEERLQQIPGAVPATRDQAVTATVVPVVQILVRSLEVLREGIAELERQIDRAAAAHPEFALFASLPGAGPALRPRLIAALGTQRDRFSSAADIQKYSGIAPVLERSGSQRWVHFRWACPKFLRQTFHEWAHRSIPRSEWARAYYQQQRGKGKSHHAAVRALAFKWIRILYRCWKDRTPYQEQIYLQALRRRAPGSPATGAPQRPAPQPTPEPAVRSSPGQPPVPSPVQLQWESIAGFFKLGVVSS